MRLANSRKGLTLLELAILGGQAEVLSSDPCKRTATLLKYLTSWKKQKEKLEKKCAQLLSDMNILEQAGSLL